MNRFCDNCGKAIGRIDCETIEGQTVCLRCAAKLKAEHAAANPTAQTASVMSVVIAAVVTVVVVGALLIGVKLIFDRLFE